jgi:hypothetical protein
VPVALLKASSHEYSLKTYVASLAYIYEARTTVQMPPFIAKPVEPLNQHIIELMRSTVGN